MCKLIGLCLGLTFGGVLWAQVFPDLNNHVAEIRVTEMSQSDDRLKVTLQNVSSRTMRGLSIVLGRHKVDADWSQLPTGGLAPNGKALVTISTAGIHSGGTRHHGTVSATLEVLSAVFIDGGPINGHISEPPSGLAKPGVSAPVPVQSVDTEIAIRKPDAPVLVPQPATGRVQKPPSGPAKPGASVVVSAPKPPLDTEFAPGSARRAATELPAVVVAIPAKAEAAPVPVQRLNTELAIRKPDAPVLVTPQPLPMNTSISALPAEAADRLADRSGAPKQEVKTPTGTHEQGSKDELGKLISLVEVYEPELASAFPRQALRQMVVAVVKEQDALAAKPAVTPFDHGRRSTLQTFAYGIQLIKDRADLDDDTLRVQVARFLRNQRQALAKR